MEKGNTFGLMVINMKVNSKMMREKVMVYMNGKWLYLNSSKYKYRGYWKGEKRHGEGEHYAIITYKRTKGIWNNGIYVIP
jgi:hypothetical protein